MLWTLMHVWGGKKGMFDEAMQTQLHYLNHACAPAEPWRSGRDNFKVAGEGGGGIHFVCIYWKLKLDPIKVICPGKER